MCAKTVLRFTPHDITRHFSEQDRTHGRADQIHGKVKSIWLNDDSTEIRAEVQTMDLQTVDVAITIGKTAGRVDIQAECTCAVGYMCQHAVAALYEALAQEDRRRERIPTAQTLQSKAQKKQALGLSAPVQAWLRTYQKSETPPLQGAPDQKQRIVYLLAVQTVGRRSEITVTPALQYETKLGTWSKPKPNSFAQLLLLDQYQVFLTPEDRAVFRLSGTSGTHGFGTVTAWQSPEDPELIDLFLARVLATNRAFTDENAASAPLIAGPEQDATLGWQLTEDERQRPTLLPAQKGLTVFPSNSPWYLDPLTRQMGKLNCPLSFDERQRFLNAPDVAANEAATLRVALEKTEAPVPAPYRIKPSTTDRVVPTPVLRIARDETGTVEAMIDFDYAGAIVAGNSSGATYAVVKDDTIEVKKRDSKREAAAFETLRATGLVQDPTRSGQPFMPPPAAAPWFWVDFRHESVPALEKIGFRVALETTLATEIIEPDDDAIDATLTQSGAWWFDLDLGIVVGGQRVQLLPVLVNLLRAFDTPAELDRLLTAEKCYAPLPDGRFVALRAQRVRVILKTLIELFDEKPLDDKNSLRVSLDLASALMKIEALTHKRWVGDASLQDLVAKLHDFSGIEDRPLPKGLHATLRTYQKEGYNWLHFLGDNSLGGILADDMGLGKTVQTLSYILARKERKKPKNPTLVVMPTSLISNWQAEAERFAPTLRVLTLHGKTRFEHFTEIPNADLVLSTYPLLTRDVEDLKKQPWDLLVLDEAQAIKNPSAKMTQAACELEATQRLCLTGTPIENHLGEAWSLFTFLMPGLLGDHRRFTRLYRTPIEQQNDLERQELLTRRLRPFILRRLKTDVAKELPPKTEIVQRVVLSDEQRDLYETVRAMMNDKVRAEVAAKGLARSQIVILDALLKLRQVCCDPRLVKLSATKKVKSSAKMDELLDMVPTLIEDGRKILLFSQFTSMLDLIKPELDARGIPYVELRGSTKDRKTPVERFQNGDVPLFLISLKAGGTGLNLTAADAVIHFDPWWNPAVENQATDRAYRIGQDKPVFVYKLIAEGTVEERILELQNKKAHLAGALYGDDPGAAAAITHDDLRWLLEEP
jgi:superfamily II DNA or RNA helicase